MIRKNVQKKTLEKANSQNPVISKIGKKNMEPYFTVTDHRMNL